MVGGVFDRLLDQGADGREVEDSYLVVTSGELGRPHRLGFTAQGRADVHAAVLTDDHLSGIGRVLILYR